MYELTVPKLNSNDVSYVLTQWFYSDGDVVPSGAEVALVETSKAAEGLVCEEGGVLLHQATIGQDCHPTEVIARLFGSPQERDAFVNQVPTDTPGSPAAEPIITEPARRLAEEHGLDLATLRQIGRKVIGRADVQRLLGDQAVAGSRTHTPSRTQRAIAEVVTLAHRTIPAAHATVCVEVDAALRSLKEYSQQQEIPVRLPELLIHAVAGLVPRYPIFFATVDDNGEIRLPTEAKVGVTIDVGRGLAVPVVAGPALASPRRIAETLTHFRESALRGRFTEEELTGGNIAVSLPAGEVILVQPLILPGQVAMVWLGASQVVPHLEPDGRLAARHVVHLGLAYDHRLINGRDAAIFLGALKQSFESPQRLQTHLGPPGTQ